MKEGTVDLVAKDNEVMCLDDLNDMFKEGPGSDGAGGVVGITRWALSDARKVSLVSSILDDNHSGVGFDQALEFLYLQLPSITRLNFP